VVEHGTADDTAADDDYTGFRLHGSFTKELGGNEENPVCSTIGG
jgi:hypothetical protein